MTVRWLVGHCLDRLRELPDRSVHVAVTSPPYWGLRSYGTAPVIWGGEVGHDHAWFPCGERYKGGTGGQQGLDPSPGSLRAIDGGQRASLGSECDCGAWLGELGSEPTLDRYIENILVVCREVRRVLRDDGTFWFNIGDAYAGSGKGPGGKTGMGEHDKRQGFTKNGKTQSKTPVVEDAKAKDLLLIPYAVAFALRADGWYIRSQIVWGKLACMPESVKDRPTGSWEPMFLFSKSQHYFYDHLAVREASGQDEHNRKYAKRSANYDRKATRRMPGNTNSVGIHSRPGPGGRNMRNLWVIGPEPNDLDHYATFPSELPRRAIAAGTSERGVCPNCMAPWERVTETRYESHGKSAKSQHKTTYGERLSGDTTKGAIRPQELKHGRATRIDVTTGWRPTCNCYDDEYRQYPQARDPRKRYQRETTGDWWRRVRLRPGGPKWATEPAVVLDPFMGAGTTALAADRLKRDAIGCELNAEYAQMAEERIARDRESRIQQDYVARQQQWGQVFMFEELAAL